MAHSDEAVRSRWLPRLATTIAAVGTLGGVAGTAAAGPTNLQQTDPVVWVMIGISIAGAVITYAVLAYSVWKFRDPKTKGRRYG